MKASIQITIATLTILFLNSICLAGSADVTCGATLSKGKFALAADLDCSNSPTPSLTIRDRAQLDLNGFTLIAHVILEGTTATLKNGRIVPSLNVGGSGGHTVENVLVSLGGGQTTIRVTSNDNRIWGVTAYFGFTIAGFTITGNNNLLNGNIAAFSGAVGFDVQGNGNTLTQNHSTEHVDNYAISGSNNSLHQSSYGTIAEPNPGAGVAISGNGNRISRIVGTTPNNGKGITVNTGASNNLIEFGVILSNAANDMVDENTDCGTNIWRKNVFQSTNNPSCIVSD